LHLVAGFGNLDAGKSGIISPAQTAGTAPGSDPRGDENNMAKGRIRSRMELREQYEAAEARERADRETRPDDEQEDEADEGEEEAAVEEAEGEEEVVPVKKKKKAAAPKEPSKRKKTAKQVPKRVVWIVYDNSYKKVKTFPFNQKKEAEAEAERLRQDKKTTHFVQPFKEDIPS
jgi:hypothetical protein